MTRALALLGATLRSETPAGADSRSFDAASPPPREGVKEYETGHPTNTGLEMLSPAYFSE